MVRSGESIAHGYGEVKNVAGRTRKAKTKTQKEKKSPQKTAGEGEPGRVWSGGDDPELIDVEFGDDSGSDIPEPDDEGMVPSWVERYREELTRELMDPLPTDYGELRNVLGKLKDVNRRMTAEAIQGALNAHAASLPHETYEEKKELAKWINAELRHFDLAIFDNKTKKPASVRADRGGKPAVGRFQVEVINENGRPQRTLSSVTLPTFQLIPVPFGQTRVDHQRGLSR